MQNVALRLSMAMAETVPLLSSQNSVWQNMDIEHQASRVGHTQKDFLPGISSSGSRNCYQSRVGGTETLRRQPTAAQGVLQAGMGDSRRSSKQSMTRQSQVIGKALRHSYQN